MPRSKHCRKGKSRKKTLISQENFNPETSVESNSEVFMTKHPLSDLDLSNEEIRERLIKSGNEAQGKLLTLEQRAEKLFGRFDPFMILSTVAAYTLFTTLDKNGKPSSSTSWTKLQQAHVELLHGLILRIEYDPEDIQIPVPEDMQEIFDLLEELEATSTQARFSQLEREMDEADLGYWNFIERLRLNTQFVRNWGHYEEVISFLMEIYSPLDMLYVDAIGLSASEIINLFKHMMGLVEDRWQDIFSASGRIFAKQTAQAMINQYYLEFPELEGQSEFITITKEKNLSKDQVKYLIFNHLELRHSSIFEFSGQTLANSLNLNHENLTQFLTNVSISLGELSSTSFGHIFLSNPVWEKPVVNYVEDSYYSPIPSLFFGFSHHIFYNLLSKDKSNKEALERRRSNFLEDKVEELFSVAFPDAVIVSGKKWKLNNVSYETDLLVKIDSHLIIIEAKSGRVPWAALRGGIKSAKSRIKKLIVEPALQASRLEDAIIDLQTNQTKDFEIDLPFELNEVQSIIKLAITLEDFATIQSNTAELVRFGVMDENTPIVPTIAIADLKIVLEMLRNEAERIHYLNRRSEIQNSVNYVGDELDLLAFYFRKGFVFGEHENSNTVLNMMLMSKPIDDYYQSLEKNGNLPKPKRALTKWYEDICQFLLKRKKPRWSEIATIILGMDFEEQKSMEIQFKRICKKLKKQKRYREGQLDIVLHIPAETRKYGIVYVTFFEEDRKRRHAIMEDASVYAFEGSAVERCLVIARDLNGKDYPYSTLAIYDREERVMKC